MIILVVNALLTFSLLQSEAEKSLTFSVFEVPTVPLRNSSVEFNLDGKMIGYGQNDDRQPSSVTWNPVLSQWGKATLVESIRTPSTVTPPANYFPCLTNQKGVAAGGNRFGKVWLFDGKSYVVLGDLKVDFPTICNIIAMNNLGWVVGSLSFGGCGNDESTEATGGPAPWLMRDGKTIHLGHGRPVSINDRGQILINSERGSYIWQDGKVTPIRYPHSNDPVSVLGMNEQGDVIGTRWFRYGFIARILWRNGTIFDLNSIPKMPKGDLLAINSEGQILIRDKSKIPSKYWILNPTQK